MKCRSVRAYCCGSCGVMYLDWRLASGREPRRSQPNGPVLALFRMTGPHIISVQVTAMYAEMLLGTNRGEGTIV